MALLSLLFDKPEKTKINAVNEQGIERELLIIDATSVIVHTQELSVTEQPIEDGSTISDHLDILPKTVNVQGIISEAPISIEQSIIGAVTGAIPALAGIQGGIKGTLFSGALNILGGLLLNNQGNRIQEAQAAIDEIQKKKILVTLITGLRAYNNMALTNFVATETAQVGGSLSFSATFKELRLVKSEVVVLPDRIVSAGVKNKATSKQNAGKQVANTTSKTGQPQSILSRLTGVGA